MPHSQRSTTIADRLGYELLLVGRSGFRRAWTAPLAYPASTIRTIAAIARHRPRAAIIVAPPFVAALVAWPFLRAIGAPFALDVHTGALVDRRWRWSTGILAWLARRGVGAVVTLPSLAAPLAARGVTTFVIPDPLPRLTPRPAASAASPAPVGTASVATADGPIVAAVCGWGDDEPIEALVASAQGRPWQLVLTGRPRRPVELPANVRLAGYLPDDAYRDLLASAACVVVLTERDQTLLSGGWEAIALGRPLVVSGTPAIRSTFGDELTYVDATPAGIAAGITAVLDDPTADARMAGLRDRFGRENDAALAGLAARLTAGRQHVGGASN